jgi:2-polyprenyl-3-methyl-5-hydroxy-6-metoxy-1,4-benzoquinol methylase
MSDFEETNCLVCKSSDYLPYSTKGQFGIISNVVICKSCGFSYLNPRWTKERYHHFYTKEYDSYYRPEIIKKDYVYDSAAGIKNVIRRAEGLIDFQKEGLNILDVGTGMGDSLIYLKTEVNKNGSYFAIESSEHCINHLNENGIKVISNDVDTDWHFNHIEKFDVIIMRHVLEHFLNPGDVLKKINAILKPNGVLYLAVPNSKKPTKPLAAHFFRVVHVSYFSVMSLTNLFTLNGLKVLKIQEGDASDQNEIFAFCEKSNEGTLTFDKNEWKVQKEIYDFFKRRELFFRFKNFIAKKIILRFK